MSDETQYLKKRLKQVYQDNEVMNGKMLLLEQINADYKMREHRVTTQLEEQIAELAENLERKENFMQSKEKKWIEIEEIMEEYAEDDEELRDKFRELKINTRPNQIISNVVFENEKMKRECKYLQNEMQRLRKILLSPSLKYDKLDDRLLGHNMKNIAERTDPELAPKVQVGHNIIGNNAMKLEKIQHPVFPSKQPFQSQIMTEKAKAQQFGQTMPLNLKDTKN